MYDPKIEVALPSDSATVNSLQFVNGTLVNGGGPPKYATRADQAAILELTFVGGQLVSGLIVYSNWLLDVNSESVQINPLTFTSGTLT